VPVAQARAPTFRATASACAAGPCPSSSPVSHAAFSSGPEPPRASSGASESPASAGLIVTTSKTDERAFKTTVRNGHDFALKVAIEDQLPVSENEEIVVEMLPSTTPPTTANLRDKRGVLEWAFEAKAGEAKDIGFAWRVKWPKDKGVVMTPSG